MKDQPKNKIQNREGGIVELIVLILIALLLMKYFGLTISGVITWFKTFFATVLK